MRKAELDNLVKIARLKAEPPTRNEYLGMVAAARSRLTDAQNVDLDPDSCFDLAYGAAHRLALAALRREGYRSENRITVFQTLVHTLGTTPPTCKYSCWRITNEILPNTRAAWKSTRRFSPT